MLDENNIGTVAVSMQWVDYSHCCVHRLQRIFTVLKRSTRRRLLSTTCHTWRLSHSR